MRQVTGWHVFAVFGLAFGTIIAVNMTLAVQAVRTFPGLEVRNSYVASQSFDADRAAQEALGWDVTATLSGDTLRLDVRQGDVAVQPVIDDAVFGRATHVGQDQTPQFTYDGTAFVARVQGGAGNWNLRLRAHAADGTVFQQRVIVRTAS